MFKQRGRRTVSAIYQFEPDQKRVVTDIEVWTVPVFIVGMSHHHSSFECDLCRRPNLVETPLRRIGTTERFMHLNVVSLFIHDSLEVPGCHTPELPHSFLLGVAVQEYVATQLRVKNKSRLHCRSQCENVSMIYPSATTHSCFQNKQHRAGHLHLIGLRRHVPHVRESVENTCATASPPRRCLLRC